MIDANRSRYGARHRERARIRQRVDWFRVLADLQYLGMSNNEAADRLGIPQRTLAGWKEGAEPRHCDGEALVALWCDMTGKSRAGLPAELAGFRRDR